MKKEDSLTAALLQLPAFQNFEEEEEKTRATLEKITPQKAIIRRSQIRAACLAFFEDLLRN